MNDEDLSFETCNYNSYFYTSDSKLKHLDDMYILSKITEKYQDFNSKTSESNIKLALLFFLKDSNHVNNVLDFFDITITDLFKIICKHYSFIFTSCYISKVHDIIRRKKYATRKRTKI